MVLFAFVALYGCSPQISVKKRVSQPSQSAPYKATLTEKQFNYGESRLYSLRVDAAPVGGDNGWFFEQDVDSGGLVRAVAPTLRWTSPTDLLVTVHTDVLSGETIRRLIDIHRSSGSVTYRYIADQR